jgi:hypothetical protein
MRVMVFVKLLTTTVLTLALSSGFAQKIFQAESAAKASVKVYPVMEPDKADLWVCFVWDESEISRTGLWMDMRFEHEADVIIYFVDEEKEADLKIWLVDTPEESQWLNQSKKNILSIKKKVPR